MHHLVKIVYRSRTRELPGNFPFSVKENLIRGSTEKWKTLTENCFQEVEEILFKYMNDIIEEHFASYVHGGLLREIQYVLLLTCHNP